MLSHRFDNIQPFRLCTIFHNNYASSVIEIVTIVIKECAALYYYYLTRMLLVLCLLLLATAYIPYLLQIKHKYLVFRLSKLYYKS